MNKLFKLLQQSFTSAPQRNGFDNSFRSVFSIKAAGIYPVFALETVPNDYHRINPVNLIQVDGMQQANFVRMRQHLDFFFVPYTLLYRNFQEIIQQTQDPASAIDVIKSQSAAVEIPVIDLGKLVFGLVVACALDFFNEQGTNIDTFLSWFDSFNTDHFEDEGGQSYIELFSNPSASSQSDNLVKDIHGYPIYRNVIKILDLLGYGNFLWLTKIDYSDTGTGDTKGWNQYYVDVENVILNLHGKKVNLFRLLAYQAICNFYYKNQIYDKLDPVSYNCDDLALGNFSEIVLERSVANARKIFDFHYRPWKYDLFTASYPDSQFGSVSVVSSNYIGVGSNNYSTNPNTQVRGFTQEQPSQLPKGSGQLFVGLSSDFRSVFSTFSILDLRRAEALQRWKEDMLRSGYRSKKRQESQFGVSPNFDPHMSPIPLGSVTQDINKDVVTGMSGDQFAQKASTASSSLGGKTIDFKASDFGIIMGVMSILPEADYDSFGINQHNMKTEAFDWYTPAFANLGLQPIPASRLNCIDNGGSGSGTPFINNIIGYAPRYNEYKIQVDELHGEFAGSPFHGSEPSDWNNFNGVFRNYVSSRIDYELSLNDDSLAFRYVNPAVLDDIFIASADTSEAGDPFKVNMYFDVKSVRPMSVLGLPKF